MSTKMEQPFYHDDSFLLGYGHNEAAVLDYKLQKPLTVTEPYRNIKPDLFPSGDVGSLKLASPELERLFIQTTGVMTTPTPGQYIYGRGITDEQEGFVEGFVKALDELHKTNPMPPPNVSIGAGGVTTSSVFNSSQAPEPPIYTTLNETYFQGQQTATINYLPSQISQNLENPHPFQSQGLINQRFAPPKDELQIVPDMHSSDGSPPMSPIDMDSQERIKAERKRLRNRLAATKCRRRKLERIARLEEKVKVLKNDNAGLSNTASVLREQVAQLKQKVLRHMNSGCQLMLTSKMEAF